MRMRWDVEWDTYPKLSRRAKKKKWKISLTFSINIDKNLVHIRVNQLLCHRSWFQISTLFHRIIFNIEKTVSSVLEKIILVFLFSLQYNLGLSEPTYLGQKYKFTFSMHCPSSPFRNPGLHLQVKPTGEETLGAKRHNWSHFVFSQGLVAWGCSAIWLASTDRGCETRWDTTVSFLPLYFLKKRKEANYISVCSCTA